MQTAQIKTVKKLHSIQRSSGSHWVGNGFPVRTLFAYPNLGSVISPFLMLDYAGPAVFPPTQEKLGVGEHPHRGFETVSIVYSGEVTHRDSAGGGGTIGEGDVQWMTAASGLVHEEFHSANFAKRGGRFEMVQLWVNLPAQYKTAPPRYQSISSEQIPVIHFPNGEGTARIIAGTLTGSHGPAETHTPLQVWDMRLNHKEALQLPITDGHNAMLVLLSGSLQVDGTQLQTAEVALFDRVGNTLQIDHAKNATLLLLSGEPLREPIVGSGPFVMNTPEEIRQAISDYQQGKMGRLA
ncbi:MAG: quercetin 2,3-dioxygenase [Betaproteobacteria bacterium HGW-Betaproteobacteria-22]|nr:MAG: quercetin 2,3-dioxygenase [Betaproteobacteria bacterium HGW-Betaproteobacteria-22]